MFIANGCETFPPSVGGPCPSVVSSGQQSWFNPKEHMAVLRRAQRFTTCAINIALLRRGALLTEGRTSGRRVSINIALLTEGRTSGRQVSINIALLTEGPKLQCPPNGGPNCARKTTAFREARELSDTRGSLHPAAPGCTRHARVSCEANRH